MAQKIWVINDDDCILPSRRRGRPSPPSVPAETVSEAPPKNPALAFSLSLLVWGGGQVYVGKHLMGAMLMGGMVLFGAVFCAPVLFWETIGTFGEGAVEKMPLLIMGAMLLFLTGLAFWALNAVDAYFRTVRLRAEPYLGVDQELWPLCCSLLLPGWGQFLNGQPVRGGVFLLLGMMGVFSGFVLSVAWHVWPFLKVSPVGYLFETCILGAFLYLPFAVFAWVASAYDAFVFCRFAQKYDLVPRLSAVLGLLLAISVGMQLFPEQYYLDVLEAVHRQTSDHQMEILQRLVQKVISLLGA